jgi:hypothetical protein
MKYTCFTALVAILVIGVTSCKKDESFSVEDKLVRKPWTEISQKYDPSYPAEFFIVAEDSVADGDTIPGDTSYVTIWVADAFQDFYGPCYIDNTLDFNENGLYTWEDTGVRCNGLNVIYEQGNWALNSDETVLSFFLGGLLIGEYDILELSKNQLILEQYIADSAGNPYKQTRTFQVK